MMKMIDCFPVKVLLVHPCALVCHTKFFQREYPEAIKNYRMALDQASIPWVVSDTYNAECMVEF